MTHPAFPIDAILPELQTQLADHLNVVLVAAPGAGKTTRVPLALMDAPWLQEKKILMLEPRRIATRNAARFMAQQLEENCGNRVGYRMRSETAVSNHTRVEVITEGLLTRMLLQDPELSEVGLIIFDEFHERNLQSDLGLALAHNCQQLLRDDLRILVMSATLDEQALAQKLDAPVVRSDGRSFEVHTHYRPPSQPLTRHKTELAKHCKQVLAEALQNPLPDAASGNLSNHDILVFLPGVAEIEALLAICDFPGCHVLPLHGRLSDQAQKQALKPASNGQRKIILATNIAESSVTIDGVGIVIDSGLERVQQFDVRSGLERLESNPISRASADQRQGRAGRQSSGHCYRLWSESSHATRLAHLSAEIERSDLSSLLMSLYAWGIAADEATWLTPPDTAALSRAQQLLQQLDVLAPPASHQTQHQATSLNEQGQQIALSGLEPRWGHALLSADQLGYGQEAARFVARLQASERLPQAPDDLELALRRLSAAQQQQTQHQANQWIKTLGLAPDQSPLNPALLVALAYPDRVARRRSQQQGPHKQGQQSNAYLLASGSGVTLTEHSSLQGHEWLAVAAIQGKQPVIRQALSLAADDLEQLAQYCPGLLSENILIEWQDSGHLQARKQKKLGQIIWRSQTLTTLTEADWQSAWLDYFQQHGLKDLPWDQASKDLCQRCHYLRSEFPEIAPMDEASLLRELDFWLLPYLTSCRHLRDLKKLDLKAALLTRLEWSQQQQLEQLLPTHWQVSSGSRIAIDYQQSPPVLAVKLQEMFGTPQQPAVLQGRLSLIIHLLSPARRPLAVTQDLASFWQNAYPDVRKEMRGRYPKHPWPEDPLSAEATRFTKRKM